MNEPVSHPTGLELRFDRELKAAIPGWVSEFGDLSGTLENPPPPRSPEIRPLPRYRPHPRRTRKPPAGA